MFRKFGNTSRGYPLSRKTEKPKMTVPFVAEIFRNSNRNFKLNGSRPKFKYKQFLDIHVLNICLVLAGENRFNF